MGDNSFLSNAIELIKQATVEDAKENYETAYKLYQRGLEYFLTALKYEKNETSKQVIRQRVQEYMTRAEQLQKHLEAERQNQKDGGSSNKKKAKQGGKGESATNKSDDEGSEKDEETGKLRGALASAIVKEKPNVKWDDVAGLEMAKDALKEAVVLPLKFPQLFVGKRKPWRGILLYGPPGTGKSYLAKAVATEVNSTFFSISSSDLVSKWLGDSEKLIRNLFEMAREAKPSIVFIDEIDSLASARSDNESEASRRIKTEFLVQMNGVGHDDDGILVLAATNLPWALDSAIRRRFQKRIYIPLPEKHARARMFQIHLGNTPHCLGAADFIRLAELSEGYSGSDIEIVTREAVMEPVRALKDATHFKWVPVRDSATGKTAQMLTPCSPGDRQAIEMELMQVDPEKLFVPLINVYDFLKALGNVKKSVGDDDLTKQIEFTRNFGSGDA
eukprot:comp14884_c0_seq1/m.21911 comp14884_c0_seq1/g.21911  ORF comp14884_c0_seq1/g.21911 comp14884_c0_seq1/m.21911 type:complete len:446 (+) comp14884_c0_seq1:3-1340(+)